MRYQIFNSRDAALPIFTAPWRWLAYRLAGLLSSKWQWCRLVDSKTGETLMEWARATDLVLGPGNATYSFVKIDKFGHRHEMLFGQTRYGMGQEPSGGHRPISIIEEDGTTTDSTQRLPKQQEDS